MDQRELLQRIAAPTLIIAGKHDQSTPLDGAEFMHARISGSALTVLDTAHIANVEQPAIYTDTVSKFLAQPAR